MQRKITRVNIGCVACAVLLLVLLAMQFIPFWQDGDISASIGAYVWLPNDHTEVTTYLQGHLGSDFRVDDMVTPAVVILAGGVIGMLMCFFGQKSWVSPILATLTGAIGTVGYLATPALQLGAGWVFHLVLCILVTLVGAVTLWWKKNTK